MMMEAKRFWRMLGLLCLACVSSALAADPAEIQGTWRWTFGMPDGSEVKPALRLNRVDGHWQGETWHRPNTRVPVTNIVVQQRRISYEVIRDRDGRAVVTRYQGEVEGDVLKGKIFSNWDGSERSYDWVAKRDAGVDGSWKWTTGGGGFRGEYTAKLTHEKGKLGGKVNSTRSEYDVKNGRYKDGEIYFEIERERDGNKFVTKHSGLIDGDKIMGTTIATFGGSLRTNTWEAVRAD